MPKRILAFVLLLAIVCLLPAAACAEDGDNGGAKPAPPVPGEEQPPAPQPPPADKDKDEEEEDEPLPTPAPEAPSKPPPKRVTNDAVSPIPVPAGMVYLEGGRVMIGTDAKELDGLLTGRPADIRKLFLYESPRHAYFLAPYFIGKHEITNAQYLRFLQDSPAEYDTASGSLANLDEVAAHLVGLSPEERKNRRQNVWKQLYFANKEAIWASFKGRLDGQIEKSPDGKVKDRLDGLLEKSPDGKVDEERTALKFRFEPLPRTLQLKFYTIQPPANWPDMAPPKGEEDHPVRFVNYNDFEKLAEWAGMHIPTEYEWEWAARGPAGPRFPWGDQWVPNASLANWGGKITNERYATTTLPVATRDGKNPTGAAGKKVPIDGDGRSWCGCYHMVGNVAEWTSSWFEAYRDSRHTNSFMGRWVKVIRGGGASDGVMLVLRPACRNYIGGGADAPPYPENAFMWAGGRLGHYMRSGQDALGPTIRRALRPQKVKEETLDVDRFVGADTHNWVESGAEPDNHVYVTGRSHSIVILPFKSFLRPEGLLDMRDAWKRPSKFKTTRGIAKKSETEYPFWLVGVLHTDVPLEPVMVRKQLTPEEEEKLKKRARGRARVPPTQKGACPPGTYLLGIWFGNLTVLRPDMQFVGFIPKMKGQKTQFEVAKVKAEERSEPSLGIFPDEDWAEFSFDMPVGGKGMDEDERLIVTGRFLFELGSLESAGVWDREDPGKALRAELWQKWLEAEAAAAKGGKGQPEDGGKPKSTTPAKPPNPPKYPTPPKAGAAAGGAK